MEKITQQEIVERVVKGIVDQGGPSALLQKREGPGFGDPLFARCLYLSPDGRRCAVGLLLDTQNSEWNASPVEDNREVRQALRDCGVPVSTREDISFLQSLQSAHDDAAQDAIEEGEIDSVIFLADFKESVETVCADWGLRFPEELMRLDAGGRVP